MKKTFLNRRNALLSPTSVSIGAVLMVCVLLFALTRALFPEAFSRMTAPLLALGERLSEGTADMRAIFTDAAELRRERDALRSENLALSTENLALSARVDDLRRLLGDAPLGPQGVIAGVLARPPESPYDTLILSAGSTSGISTGMRVEAPGSVPIGSVESVSASSARVLLYSSPGNTISGWVGAKRVPVSLVGMGGGGFAATVPTDAGVAQGDIVYATLGGALPIGRVAKVDTNAASPSAELSIATLANLFSLVWVKVIP